MWAQWQSACLVPHVISHHCQEWTLSKVPGGSPEDLWVWPQNQKQASVSFWNPLELKKQHKGCMQPSLILLPALNMVPWASPGAIIGLSQVPSSPIKQPFQNWRSTLSGTFTEKFPLWLLLGGVGALRLWFWFCTKQSLPDAETLTRCFWQLLCFVAEKKWTFLSLSLFYQQTQLQAYRGSHLIRLLYSFILRLMRSLFVTPVSYRINRRWKL